MIFSVFFLKAQNNAFEYQTYNSTFIPNQFGFLFQEILIAKLLAIFSSGMAFYFIFSLNIHYITHSERDNNYIKWMKIIFAFFP